MTAFAEPWDGGQVMITGGEATRARWLAALRAAFGPEGDPAARAAILARLLADLTPADRAAGRTRWQAWAYDRPTANWTGTAEEQRCLALLPALLAGTLDPTGDDYTWLQECLAQWDAAQAEYAELQQILDDERAARQDAGDAATASPPPTFPAPDLSFLTSPPAGGPDTDWAAVQIAVKGEAEAGARRILLLFAPQQALRQVAEEPALYAPQPDHPLAGVADAGGEWTALLARTVDLGGPPGHPGSVTVIVQARRTTPATCHLFIHLSGPGVDGHETEARLLVEWPARPTTAHTPDPQGLARLTVPLADLNRLVITIQLA